MLSDKKEALDVVEDKLSEVLNKTRTGDNFQNPILRLEEKEILIIRSLQIKM